MRHGDKHKALMIMALTCTATVLACLNGCTTDNDEGEVMIQPITFTTPILQGISRAAVTDAELKNPYDVRETFRIFGSRYEKDCDDAFGSAAMKEYDGEVVRYRDDRKCWDTDMRHYWSNDERWLYAFRGYSPADIEGAHYDADGTGLKIDAYTTPEIGRQYDLLYAPAIYGLRSVTSADDIHNDIYGRVNILFTHALASVHFRVRIHPKYIRSFEPERRENEAARYGIRQITVSNVYNCGWFDEGDAQGIKSAERHDGGITRKELWSMQTINPDAGNSYDFLTPGRTLDRIPYRETAEDIKDLDDRAHIGFMIPQDLPDDTEFKVTWTYDDSLYVTRFGLDDISRTGSRKWDAGKRYIYTLSFFAKELELKPSAESMVEDWEKNNKE